jgi:hypothetical protein
MADKPGLHTVEGIPFAANVFMAANVLSGLAYKARPDDVFIISHPKSGTTWMEAIVYGLLHGGRSFAHNMGEYLTSTPFLELHGADVVEKMSRPGTIKTHLPFDRVPKHPQAKYICLIRNPKDVCVSFYHFSLSMPGVAHSDSAFNTYFEDFLAGRKDYGDYFDWVLRAWEHKDDDNVLLIAYEEMKKDIRSVIRKVVGLLNIELTDELLENVTIFSSFNYMKENFDVNRKAFEADIPHSVPELRNDRVSVRKGAVGDWKTMLSDEQSRRINDQFREKTRKHTELRGYWDRYENTTLNPTNNEQH